MLIYVQYMASENLLYDRGTPKLVFCDNSEGWDGEGGLRGRGHKGKKKKKRERTHVYLLLIHVDIWQKPSQYCKVIIFH